MARQSGYSALQISLHWIVAILIFAAWFLGEGMGKLLHQKMDGTFTGSTPLHVILGIAVLVFVVIRIATRVKQGAPDAVPSGQPLLDKAAGWMHGLLYLLMVLVPVGGILTWGAGFASLGDVHAVAGNALFFLALAHAAVGIFHGVVKKDGVMTRMMKPAA